MHRLRRSRKPRGLHVELVLLWKQSSDLINSLLVAGDLPNGTRADGYEFYGRPGNRLVLRIKNGAAQARIVALTQTIDLNKQAANSEQHRSRYVSEDHRMFLNRMNRPGPTS